MYYNIAIIGLGNIGLRHLEGILKLKHKINIYLIDNSVNALESAKKLIYKENNNKKLFFSFNSRIIKFNKLLDCAIISTTANVRFEITVDLLNKNKIKNIIFEKVLFNNIAEYKKILKITQKNKIKCYVNYSRKFMNSYQKLKKELISEQIINMKLCGSNWGLASNIFHFLDIFSFLTNEKKINLLENNLNKNLFKSKRKGFFELKGELSFKNSKNHKLVCIDSANYKITNLRIETENFIFLIDETKKIINKIFYKHISKNGNKKFNFLYQSEMTGQYINLIINNKKLSLSSLKESYDHFKIIMNIINKNYKNKKLLIT